MKKGGFLLICLFILIGCQIAGADGPSTNYVMQNTWEEIDQATDEVQAARPIPDAVLVPPGGTTNQVLGKLSTADGDTGWIDQSGGGEEILKWYKIFNRASLTDDAVYPWLRPFEEWRIISVVGRVDSGEATVDLRLCDTDLTNCNSYLSAPLTLTPAEQSFILSADGITANKRLVAVNVGTATANEIFLDAHGTYETGTPPASGSCTTPIQSESGNSGSEKVGNITGRYYVASVFTAAKTTTICAVDLTMNIVGSPPVGIEVGIYTFDEANSRPGTLIGAFSTSKDAADFTDVFASIRFEDLSAAITQGTKYCVVAHVEGNYSSNYYQVQVTNTASTPGIWTGDTTQSWSVSSGSNSFEFTLLE